MSQSGARKDRKQAPPSSREGAYREAVLKGTRCYVCGSKKPAIRLRVNMLLADFVQASPEQAAMLAAVHGSVPTFETIYGPAVMVLARSACDLCRVRAEVEAARLHSSAFVEIDRYPSRADNLTVQVRR